MPRVTILRRDQSVRFTGARQAEDVVEVAFVSDAYGVRSVTLPLESYRPATDDELVKRPRYRMVPVDKAADGAERKAIEEALQREAAGEPSSFDVP